MKRMLLIMAALLLALPVIPASHAETVDSGVLITEFFPDPGGSDLSAEFIEISNIGDSPVNITGWYITDQDGPVDFTFPETTMEPGDIAVVYAGNSTFRWSGGMQFFMNRSTSMLNNGGDDISLFDKDDNLMDYVSYGNGSMVDGPVEGKWQSAPLPEEGLSISRDSDGAWFLSMPTPGLSNPMDDTADITISSIYPVARYSDEFFAIRNEGTESADISGYMLTDGEGSLYLPPTTDIAPGDEIYITRNASGFLSEMGFMPDMSYSDCYTPSYFPQLSNSGDSLELLSPSGSNLSFVSYGSSLRKGHYLHLEGDEWVDRKAGWMYEKPLRIDFSGSVIPYSSPENSFSTLMGLVDSASSYIAINTYSFESPELAEHLISALSRGVSVSLLIEGRPVSGMSDSERKVLDALSNAGADIRVKNGTERYRYDHAKYMVIDGDWALIQSENLNPDALRENCTWGNRGWGIAVDSLELSSELMDIFRHDSDLNFSDVGRYTPSEPAVLPSISGCPVPVSRHMEGNITLLSGPDNGLDEVISSIDSAEKSVYVEQFYIKSEWAGKSSPLVDALVSAARRGCEVRVLLDGEFYNLQGEDDNDEMAAYLNGIAEKEGLNMEARVIDSGMHDLVKVHNKGMIIDGREVLISSFNWGMNSFTYNREMALLVENSSVASYYTSLFSRDWKNDFIRPVAAISGPDTIIVNSTFVYTSASTDDREIASTSWYLDGNFLSSNSSVSLNFSAPGNHTLLLNVSDGEGNRNSTFMDISVKDSSQAAGEVPPGSAPSLYRGNYTHPPAYHRGHTAGPIDTETESRDMPSSSAIYYILMIPAAAILGSAAHISRKKGKGHS